MKNMKTSKSVLSLALIVASLNSFAEGGGSSGGGGSFVCKIEDPTSRQEIILSAESQDLWEASLKNRVIISNENEKDLSRNIIKRLNDLGATRFQSEVAQALETVLSIRDIKPVKLVSLQDSLHWLENAVCPAGKADFAPAAIYKGKELVYSSLVFNKMDNVSKAALNVHEAVYKILRDEYRDKDSLRTRQIVGYLFSDQNSEEIIDLIPSDSYNPFSSKSQKEKFQLQADLFNKGTYPSLNDLNKVPSQCYILNRGDFNLRSEVISTTKVELSPMKPIYNRNLKFKGYSGSLSFEKIVRNPLKGRTTDGFFKADLEIVKESPIENPLILGNDIRDSAGSRSSVADPDNYKLLVRKTVSGDLVFAESSRRPDCLKFVRHGFLNLSQTCVEYKNQNTLRSNPEIKVDNFIYCSMKE